VSQRIWVVPLRPGRYADNVLLEVSHRRGARSRSRRHAV